MRTRLILAPKNDEQQEALDLLFDPDVHLVMLLGPAGTGKTLLATYAGISQAQTGTYDQALVTRPLVSVGEDLGYLPGTVEEKLLPWSQPIFDAIEVLLAHPSNLKRAITVDTVFEDGLIVLEPLSFVRGRSIHNRFMIVDECFPANQHIATENGKMKIGSIYRKFKSGKPLPKVISYNERLDKFEPKRVLNAWNKGTRKLMRFRCSNRWTACTPNHKFLTPQGWLSAEDLKLGELIFTSPPDSHQLVQALGRDQEQVILGGYLGDGSVQKTGLSRYRIKFIHGESQADYCKWKAWMFGVDVEKIDKNGYAQTPAYRATTKVFGMDVLEDLATPKTNCPQWLLEKLDARGLAIWFMDDGNISQARNGARISVCNFDLDTANRMSEALARKFGIETQVAGYGGYLYLNLRKEACERLVETIAPYVHPNLAYKVWDHPLVGTYPWSNQFMSHGFTVVDEIQYDSGEEEVFDIEVEGNHNFIVCSSSRGRNKTTTGLIAHNCQNLDTHEIKTILTRAGTGTKVVLLGDPEQIDTPHLTEDDNGLVVAAEKFANKSIAATLWMEECFRSPLAKLAAELL